MDQWTLGSPDSPHTLLRPLGALTPWLSIFHIVVRISELDADLSMTISLLWCVSFCYPLDKFAGCFSLCNGGLESKWPTVARLNNGPCDVTLDELSRTCLQTSLLVGFEETLLLALLWVWRHYWSGVTMGGEGGVATQVEANLRYLWALSLSQHISRCHPTDHHRHYLHL